MDILKSIQNQIKEIHNLSSDISLDAVQTHIERAEKLYDLGTKGGDEQFFTDVIYRTNQAFEGSLKQAYMILNNQSEEKTNKKRTVDIENYFETNSIFHERVLHHFKNYRQEWRNKSTHDFKLFFSESEAFLAIVNVSAYTYVLFNQIIEKLAYNVEKERLANENKQLKVINSITKQKDVNLKTKTISLIQEFSKTTNIFQKNIKEVEIIGALRAFLESASDDYKVQSEVSYQIGSQKIHIDLLLDTDDEELIIEVKRPNLKHNSSYDQQMIKYMELANIPNSILWIPRPIKEGEKLDVVVTKMRIGSTEYETTIVK